ncbi:MAG: hypothetical protein HC893_09600 [Chloroflexaceae bacterium]|nr:hypothetical protein [Chloroflexaceae bacterium]
MRVTSPSAHPIRASGCVCSGRHKSECYPPCRPNGYAVAGNLYSREGIRYLVRNVLARPTLRTIVLCGRDMTGSGAALLALMEHGIDTDHRIIGDGTRLHTEIPADAIALFRHSVRLIDARDRIRPEAVAALLPTIEPIHEPFAPAPLIFPYTEPQATTLPAEQSGFVVRGRTIVAPTLT